MTPGPGNSRKTSRTALVQVRFWGVRGSYPTSDRRTLGFGGHSSCVEIKAGPLRLIFDAGTGIIPLGRELVRSRSTYSPIYIFLSHTHHDHISGICFFRPLDLRTARISIFGPESRRGSLKSTLERATQRVFFPVALAEFSARKRIYSLKGGENIRLGTRRQKVAIVNGDRRETGAHDDIVIATHKSPAHPNGVMLYRVQYRDRSVVYATDIEQIKGGYREVIRFARGTDLLIHDAQYLDREYFSRSAPRKGWGHSTLERAVEVAQKAAVKKLILFHHEPTHDDKTIGEMERAARRAFPVTVAAREGMKVDLF